jgi:DNA-directed RNA polymerase subunit K/omega
MGDEGEEEFIDDTDDVGEEEDIDEGDDLALEGEEVPEDAVEAEEEGKIEGVEEEVDADLEIDEEAIKDLVEPDTDVYEVQKVLERRKNLVLPNRLSKYELTAIIGYRAQQIAESAPPYIKVTEGMDPLSIAVQEFIENKIPLMIERPIPANKIGRFKYETYRLDELVNVIPFN